MREWIVIISFIMFIDFICKKAYSNVGLKANECVSSHNHNNLSIRNNNKNSNLYVFVYLSRLLSEWSKLSWTWPDEAKEKKFLTE